MYLRRVIGIMAMQARMAIRRMEWYGVLFKYIK